MKDMLETGMGIVVGVVVLWVLAIGLIRRGKDK